MLNPARSPGRSRKALKTRFSKNHTFYPIKPKDNDEDKKDNVVSPWGKRLSHEWYELVVRHDKHGIPKLVDCDGLVAPAHILRPAKREKSQTILQYNNEDEDEDPNSGQMLPLHKAKTEEMISAVYHEHSVKFPDCDLPDFKFNERKVSICWKVQVQCKSCGYLSEVHKLYEEVDNGNPGQKPCAPIYGMATAMLDSPVGVDRTRHILACTGIPPPGKTNMHKTLIKVGEKVETLSKDDMTERQNNLTKVNELRGMPSDAPIRVSIDGRYNSHCMKTRYRPGQGASQMTGFAVEDHTDKKQIIAAFLDNKLCWIGAYLRGQGYEVECPGHAGCTATSKDIDLPFSELNLGHELGKQLSLNGLLIKYATTDGDGKSAQGLDEHYKSLNPMWEVLRLSDLTHLGAAQTRAVGRATFSKSMFADINGYENKKRAKQVLSHDIGYRCGIEFTNLHKHCDGNVDVMSAKMGRLVETILDCYNGDHKNCRKYSYTCKGGQKFNWFSQSYQLKSFGYVGFDMSKHDRELLQKIVNMKLGVSALKGTFLGTTTAICESYNSSLNAACPKNNKCSRTAKYRMYSTVHKLNNGPGKSAKAKLEYCGIKVKPGSETDKYLQSCEKNKMYQKEYSHRPEVKRQRSVSRAQRFSRYYKKMTMKNNKCPEYKKGQLDPKVPTKGSKNRKTTRKTYRQ